MQPKIININVDQYELTLTINPPNPDGSTAGTIQSNSGTVFDLSDGDERFMAAFDAIESLILAQACEGLNVTDDAYIRALRTTVEAIENNMD